LTRFDPKEKNQVSFSEVHKIKNQFEI